MPDGLHCTACGRELIPLEISLTLKLLGRGMTSYLCKTCLAAKMKLTEGDLDELAEMYKKQGCTLFC